MEMGGNYRGYACADRVHMYAKIPPKYRAHLSAFAPHSSVRRITKYL